MEKKKGPMVPGPFQAIENDPDACIGCETCVDIRRMDVPAPDPEPGLPPVVACPDG